MPSPAKTPPALTTEDNGVQLRPAQAGLADTTKKARTSRKDRHDERIAFDKTYTTSCLGNWYGPAASPKSARWSILKLPSLSENW